MRLLLWACAAGLVALPFATMLIGSFCGITSRYGRDH